MELKEAGAR